MQDTHTSSCRARIPGGPASVADVLERPVEQQPDDEALVGRHARLSFGALDLAANRAAHALADLGVRPGDRVAASLPNQPELVVAFFGAMRLGAIWVGIHRQLAPAEKAYMLEDCGAGVYLTDPETAQRIAERTPPPSLRHTVTVEVDGRGDWSDRLASMSADRPDVRIDPHAPAAIAYTSGTTGFPKGAVHSQHNLLLPGALQRAEGARDRSERIGVCLPLTLLNLMILGPVATAQLGLCCVTMDRVDAVGLAEWIERERLATFAAVPTMVHDLLHHPDVRPEQLASLVRPGAGGAAVPEHFRQLYRERFGAEVMLSYGLTEAPTVVTRTDPDAPPVPDESGTAVPYLDVHIRDAQGLRLPAGEVGEICLAARHDGPWADVYTPMLGYWERPEETAKALRDGVLHTGDLGMLDANGHLFVKDRRNDLIVRGGANVYPAEVERILHAHPDVEACAVVGAPDERLGERVVAFVQPRADTVPTPEVLAAHVGAHLARYKVPERFELVDAFPRSPMGKIRKTELKRSLRPG